MNEPDGPTPGRTRRGAEPQRLTHLLVAVGLVFVLSRLIAYRLGVRFDVGGLTWFWQYLEPDLLAHDLVRSLYYLHMQPPLFNLFLGCVLKLFPGDASGAFAAAYLVMGLALAISICVLMVRLGVRPRVSLILTVLFVLNPASILYENFLFYTYPVTLLLVLAALALHRYVTVGRSRDAFRFFVLLTVIALTRSLFHLAWFGATVALVAWGAPRLRRVTLTAAVLPGLAIVGWYLKNLIVFGSFSASTWMGMSLWKNATWKIPGQDRLALIDQGTLSPIAAVKAFRPLAAYSDLLPLTPPTHIPALDRELKAGGAPNFNHLRYIAISKGNARDALALLNCRPWSRCTALADALFFYFVPASDYVHLHDNRAKIALLERLYDLALGQLAGVPAPAEEPAKIPTGGMERFRFLALSLVVSLPLLFVWACRRCWGFWRRPSRESAFTLTLAFCCLNIAWVTMVGNVVELGENMRFRFQIDPLFLVLLGLVVNDWLARRSTSGTTRRTAI